MTDCTKVKGYIDRYLRDELDKRKRGYIEGHVKNCIMCSAEMEFTRKKISVTELLSSLQQQPSFFRRIGNTPKRIKQKIRRAFSKHPVILPTALILIFAIFAFIPAGLYLKKNNISFKKTDETKEIIQAAQEIKKPSTLTEMEQKSAPVNPLQSKQEKKDVKPANKKQEAKSEQKAIDNPKEIAKKEERAEKKAETVSAKTETTTEIKKEEQKLMPSLYRLKLKSDLQLDVIFTMIESLSENSNALILHTKGFMPDSSEKKEVLVRIPMEKYASFLKEMKNQFTNVSSVADKNIKLSNDISKQEGQSFVLIEIN